MKHGVINVVEKYDIFYNTPLSETKLGETTPTHECGPKRQFFFYEILISHLFICGF